MIHEFRNQRFDFWSKIAVDFFVETDKSDGCMVKTVIRRKQQFHDIVSKISGKNISGMICAPLETFTWAPELLDG